MNEFDELGPGTVNRYTDDVWRDELRHDYAQIRGVYAAGIREITTRLETLDEEFERTYRHNPIHHIESRLKTLPSIVNKLRATGSPLSIGSAKKQIHDIAGVRVVCRYVDDIHRIARLLLDQDDISLIEKKDYIEHPKPNGYRSLHVVVDVPVYMSHGRLFVPVEIQIRTVAMDFWATLEHGIRYKSEGEVPAYIQEELHKCADIITQTDYKMQEIFQALRLLNDKEDEFADL